MRGSNGSANAPTQSGKLPVAPGDAASITGSRPPGNARSWRERAHPPTAKKYWQDFEKPMRHTLPKMTQAKPRHKHTPRTAASDNFHLWAATSARRIRKPAPFPCAVLFTRSGTSKSRYRSCHSKANHLIPRSITAWVGRHRLHPLPDKGLTPPLLGNVPL